MLAGGFMVKVEAASLVVCDAGPLIHLDELTCIDVLMDFTEVLVPSIVWREVEFHRPIALAHESIPFKRVSITGQLPASLQAAARLFSLHRGELRALQLAQRRNADILLTDDTAARLASKALNIPVHGTIGMLLRAIRRGQRSSQEVIELLRKIPSHSSLHVRPSLLTEIILEIEQSL
jgi:predicted nucleic acid-binding protein